MPREGDIIGGTYRLVSIIGKGGMGSVWKAEKITTRELLAIKFMKYEYVEDENSLERFKREIEILKSIRHPNVVYIFDWYWPPPGEVESPYIVMEHLEGEPLIELLKRESTIEISRAITIMVQILDALVASHSAGVVHRDLGPQNVFLMKSSDDKIRVKLLDFGLAKPQATTREITRVGTVLGRVTYAAPEHFLGQPTDERSDIFSCGMMMVRMLTGRLPYKETKIETLWVERRNDSKDPAEYPSARSLDPTIPKMVDDIIVKAIKKKPGDRYKEAFDMQADLMEVELELDADEPTEVYMPRHAESMVDFLQAVAKKREAAEAALSGGKPEAKEGLLGGLVATPVGDDDGVAADADLRSMDVTGSTESEIKTSAYPASGEGRRRFVAPLVIGITALVALIAAASYLFYSGDFETASPAGEKGAAGPWEEQGTGALEPLSGSQEHAVVEEGGKESEEGEGEGAGEGEQPAEDEPETVKLTLVGTPPGAAARAGNAVLDGDPLRAELVRSQEELTLEVSAEGYDTYVKTIVPDQDQDIEIAMVKSQDQDVAVEGASAAKGKKAGAGKKKFWKKKTGKKKTEDTGGIKGPLNTKIITDYED
jgi:serine/threonine protein kinase